ncbi:glycosyltransferase family 4 protein [Salinivibrio proteolyticus]|uniref:Glycosyltransferase family 4 protein n=1 Tax=Salinivibrio proteolyticus TaxID=334715 RepID=A0ABY7LCL1_9GAMM|nr:glycosyltransferase family 4 protein [Salinivibrio proteolyticus]WBA13972.1 glycosyltransferase family 4 protein [Salinivibrio proteolyticus]
MRILVVSQYFWPENFRINDLCISLTERGHDVTVLTGKPNYPDGELFPEYISEPECYDNLSGIKIIRASILPRKKGGLNLFLNYISFVVSAAYKGAKTLRKRDFDVVLACQLSPVTSVLPAIFIKKKKKIPLVMWSLDLWPESLQAVGAVKSDRVIGIIGRLVSYVYKHCDLILAQSEEYLSAIEKRDASGTPKVIFPNWAEDIFSINRKDNYDRDNINIIFAGNIGDAQGFDALVECAKLIKESDLRVQFSIIGDGRRRQRLEEEIKKFDLEEIIILFGKHPLDAMPRFYAKADAALVSLKSNDVFSRTIPGKVQSYMLASLPILGMIDGSTSKLIDIAKCGITCGSDDYRALFNNIKIFCNLSSEKRRAMGLSGYRYASTEFNKEKLITRLEKSLNSLIEG